MGNLRYRNDNKKLLIWIYIAFIALAIIGLVINVLNTKKILNLYILLGIDSFVIVSYLFFYLIFIKKNKCPLSLEDNYLAFYVSFNKYNKKLKIVCLLIDIFELLMITFVSVYYLYKMDFINVYGIYPLFGVLLTLILCSFVIIKDILRYNSMDRIDVHTSGHQFSIIDKKLLYACNLVVIALANIGILAFTKPHFVVYYTDLILFEIISFILLIISLSSVFITKLYYYHFDLKQIEQTEFDTKILEPIGEGKYAKVYKAYISSLDTVYAIKKLESNDATDIERFKAEFEMMKMFEHENLLRVYSFDELHYEYMMDYCKYSLEDYLKGHKLSTEQKRMLTTQLLSAFDYLHNHNIMHRDVSPSNIMIKENEKTKEITLKVMDFGIAKNNNELRRTRVFTRVKGTLIDPSLELFSKYNEQNDIYGLGIIINFINYGTDAIIQDKSDVANIVNRCMDIDLTKRYHYVSEIIKDYKEASL